MEKDYFKINEKIFNKKNIKPLILDNGMCRPITIDGPISIKYNKANPRILWVLKEPHNTEVEKDYKEKDRSLIEWILEDIVRSDKPSYSRWHATYSLIIKISYGILFDNLGIQAFSGHPLTYKKCLESIAVINLNKFGGGEKESKHYEEGKLKCKEIVQLQLENLKPQIIILAGTGEQFTKIMKNTPSSLNFPERFSPSKDNFPNVIDAKGTVYISTYHTNQRTITGVEYYNRIIQAIKDQ